MERPPGHVCYDSKRRASGDTASRCAGGPAPCALGLRRKSPYNARAARAIGAGLAVVRVMPLGTFAAFDRGCNLRFCLQQPAQSAITGSAGAILMQLVLMLCFVAISF